MSVASTQRRVSKLATKAIVNATTHISMLLTAEKLGNVKNLLINSDELLGTGTVSYTHLTLPTTERV